MVIKQSKWTNATIATLRELYLQKDYSATQIAQILGFTKNAIIGKIHRLNLNDEKQPINKVNQKKVLSHKGKIKLDHIEYNMCVWPSEEINKANLEKDFLFCGEPVVAGKSYCKEHLEQVYLSTKKVVTNINNLYKESDDSDYITDDNEDTE